MSIEKYVRNENQYTDAYLRIRNQVIDRHRKRIAELNSILAVTKKSRCRKELLQRIDFLEWCIADYQKELYQ